MVPTHELGCVGRGRPDGIERGLTEADLVAELDRVPAVRIDAAVGTEGYPGAACDRLAEPLPLSLRRRLVLCQDLRRPAGSSSLLGDPVAVVDVGDEARAATDQQLDPFVVDERAMLDRAHAGPDRGLDALGPVGVGSNEDTLAGGLLDGGAEEAFVQFNAANTRASGEDGTRGDALDEIGTATDERADPFADVIGRPDDAETKVIRHDEVARQPGHLATATRCRDIRPGALHPRPRNPADVDRPAEGNIDERPERADIADGRETGSKRQRGHCGRRTSPHRPLT